MKRYRDEKWLRQKIEEENKSRVKIAQIEEVSHKTIMKYSKRYNVGDDLVKCPNCEFVSSQLAKHWSSNNCDYPKLNEHQRDVLTGILMGDGSINLSKGNQNPRFRIDMYEPSLPYLNYLSSKIFPVITTSVSEGETAKSSCERNSNTIEKNLKRSHDMYYLSSRRMPFIKEYEEWYINGHKFWPCEDINMNPTIFKHLYVGDGHLYKKSESYYISIAANDQYEIIDEVVSMFNDVGLNPNIVTHDRRDRIDVEIRFNKDDTESIFNWIGEPLPGFEYKWPEKYRN